jgi:hypothetical protein
MNRIDLGAEVVFLRPRSEPFRMRRVLPIALLALIVALVIVSMAAGGSKPVASAASGENRWGLTLAPVPDDLALAQVSFNRAARGQAISASSLQVSVSGPFGDDYLAAAVPRLAGNGVPRALVLLVNRPSPLLDPVSVHLQLSARRALGAPLLRRLTNPFTRPGGGRATLCDLPLHGSALSPSELRPLHSRGQALAGFDAASAIAQAYDAACGLPHASSFEQAVKQPSAPPPSPPSPPVGKLPGEGCKPAPGYACPGAVRNASPAVAVGG